MDGLGLNLAWLNDSVSSSLSNTFQDVNSNSNLNSASSLSWAEDVSVQSLHVNARYNFSSFTQEVENHATFKVQQCLDTLEEYLLTGYNNNQKSFDLAEASLWRDLVTKFK